MQDLIVQGLVGFLIGIITLNVFRKFLGVKLFTDMDIFDLYASITLGIAGMKIIFNRDYTTGTIEGIFGLFLFFLLCLIVRKIEEKKKIKMHKVL